MKPTYDRSVNAAYIYVKNEIGVGEVKTQYHCDINYPAASGRGIGPLE